MADETSLSGWIRLNNGYDVEFQHGIPLRVSDNGLGIDVDDAALVEEVSALSGLTVVIDDWVTAEDPKEHEASLCIDALQFEEVLQRLARSSAALFVERYHTAIDEDSVDWDSAEFARDFNHAAEVCCLDTSELNRDDYFKVYVTFMHTESKRLINEGVSPLVDAE